jgi:hypothetical protein
MQALATTFVRTCAVVAVACWVATVFYMFRTVALRKPRTSLWKGTAGNPFNLLLQPQKLTDAGLASRRRCFYSDCGFVGVLLLAIVVGKIAGL